MISKNKYKFIECYIELYKINRYQKVYLLTLFLQFSDATLGSLDDSTRPPEGK